MSYILGLDLGTNSIGWACIDEENQIIIDTGVRIFQEGVNHNTQGKEVSKNEDRRLARQSRRQYERKRQRKEILKSLLKEHGMFPSDPMDEIEFFNLNKKENNEQEIREPKFPPYALRKKGLDEKLSKLEFGRCLYHMNQRRGFKSSRKSGDSTDDGKVATATTDLQKQIEDNKCRTLGEYFASLDPMDQRIRGRYTLRKMYELEFDLLWEKQREYYPEYTDELKNEIRDRVIFYQRPLKAVHHLIGKCSLEPAKKRCPKDAFEAQTFRILEQVNRLEFTDEDGVVYKLCRSPIDKFAEGQTPSLEDFEAFDEDAAKKREALITALSAKKEMKFEDIKKCLGFTPKTQCNLEKGGLKKLLGDRTQSSYRSLFKKQWDKFSQEERDKIHKTVSQARDTEWLEEHARKKWGLDEKTAKKLSKTGFEPGYMHFSRKAIKNLLPFLRAGLTVPHARMAAGYKEARSHQNIEEQMEKLRNPIVSKTLYELMRLVHKIEQAHGKPGQTRIELLRALKSSAKNREETHFKNLENKKANDEAKEEVIKKGYKPTHETVLKYKLWKECKEQCPYTGKMISQTDLFENNKYQIEHIIPYSRSLDDSFANKTLCEAEENKRKGNHTPYEFYNGTDQYDAILKRIKVLPFNKQRKFRQKEISKDFVARQLNDSSYISVEAKNLLTQLGHKATVAKGQATSELRHQWGLNSLLTGGGDLKNRDDHRHHALDAVVVALTTQGILNNLSKLNKYKKSNSDKSANTENASPAGWKNFREILKPFIENMLVSHCINKRARGSLHEETLYGDLQMKDDKGAPLYAIRKPLTGLDASSKIEKIADPIVKQIIIDHLRASGVDVDKKKYKIPGSVFKDVQLFMRSTKGLKIPIKKVRLHQPANNMILLPKRNRTGVEPGGNHHVVIYRYKDEKGKAKQGGEICTRFEAVRRKVKKEPIIKRELEEGKEFICSLAINEMVLLGMKEDQIDWENPDRSKLKDNLYRVQKISNDITFRHHLYSILKNDNGIEVGRAIKQPSGFKGIKVRIDRLGRIHKAHD